MATRIFMICFTILWITGILCRPSKRFLELDCNTEHNCTDEQNNQICCTDGNTYASQCHINRVNQIKVCDLGDFNPVEIVHDGPCHKA